MTQTRTWNKDQMSGEPTALTLYLKMALDGSGDPGTITRRRGFNSTPLTHNSTGNYTLTLEKAHNALLGVDILYEKSTDAAVRFQIASETVSTNGQISLRFYNLSSPADLADPISCVVHIRVVVKQSSAGYVVS